MSKYVNVSEELGIFTDFSAPGSYFADFDVIIVIPIIETPIRKT